MALAFQMHLGEPDPALAGDGDGVEQIDPTVFCEDRGVTELVHRNIDGAATVTGHEQPRSVA